VTPDRPAARLALLALIPAVLAGCLDVAVPSASPTLAPTAEPTAPTITYAPGTTVWYEGLLITVQAVSATLDKRGGPVIVVLRLENPGADDAELDARVLLQVDADTAATPLAPTRDSKIPTVPAGGTAEAALTYELQGVASVDRGVVLIGELPLHVARVPLTVVGGEAETLQPIELALSGVGTAGDLRIATRGAVLRWDLPDWSEELSAELAVLTLTYDVTYLGDFSGGFPFTGENVALRLPTNTLVASRRDGHSQSFEVIGAGKTKKGLFSRFELPSGMTGRFALVLRNGSASRALTFLLGD